MLRRFGIFESSLYFLTCLFMSIWDNALPGCGTWFNEKTRLGRSTTITCLYTQTLTTREKYSHTSTSGRDFRTCLAFGILQAWLKFAMPLSRLTLGPILGPVPMRKSLSKTGWQRNTVHALLFIPTPLSASSRIALLFLSVGGCCWRLPFLSCCCWLYPCSSCCWVTSGTIRSFHNCGLHASHCQRSHFLFLICRTDCYLYIMFSWEYLSIPFIS